MTTRRRRPKLTDTAATLINRLVADDDLADTAGLRFITARDHGALAMSLVDGPENGDEVIVLEGASMFVSPCAAERMEDQTLHAQLDDRPAFYLDVTQ